MNVLCLGARIISADLAKKLVVEFLNARFLTDEKYQRRLDKVLSLERSYLKAVPFQRRLEQNALPDPQILACDLGGTRMRIALVSLKGRVHDKQVVLSLDNNPNTLIDSLRTALNQAPARLKAL